MKFRLTPATVFLFLILVGCSSKQEYVMPFRNFGYSGERLFPVSENNSEFTLSVWVSYSTSIDRVFTISYDSLFGYQGKLLEIESNSVGKNKKDRTVFKQMNIVPRDGFEKFILKVDSLNLTEVKDQDQNNFSMALHQPFSLY